MSKITRRSGVANRPKVHQASVTTGLDPDPSGRRVSQVGNPLG
jgi:hypothetical protein